MKARFIITLLTISIFTMACRLTSLPSAMTTEAPVSDAPAAPEILAQPASQVSTEPEAVTQPQAPTIGLTYPIVDTNQEFCYDDSSSIPCPSEGSVFYGQDAQYTGNAPRYQDNKDGTVTDLVTGLMWQQDPSKKMTYNQAVAGASSFSLAGYTDWRLPSIKELYSLIQHSGTDASVCMANGTCSSTPFIDTDYFNFE